MTTGRDAAREVLASHAAGGGILVGEAVGVAGIAAGIKGSLLLTPLSEATAAGAAVGLALAGKRPLVELLDAEGLGRAVEALAESVDVSRRSAGNFRAPVVILSPLPPVGVLPRLPEGVRRFVVANAADLGPALVAALAADTPAVVLYGGAATGPIRQPPPTTFGAPHTVREGAGVVVLAEGDGVATALEGAGSAHIVDLRGERNPAVIAALIAPTGRAVFCTHESAEALFPAVNAAFWRLEAPPAFVHPVQGAAAVQAAVHASATA